MTSQNEGHPKVEDPSPEKPKARKPYTKPAFRSEKVFETMALSCGKINSSQANCKFNRKSS